MKKKITYLLVLFLFLGVFSSPARVQAKSAQDYTYIKISGKFDPACSGEAGVRQLNNIRAKAGKSKVIYSPALEKTARSMVAPFIVAGKNSKGYLKSPTADYYDVASMMRKNIVSSSMIGFVSYAYSLTAVSKGASLEAITNSHFSTTSPGVYGAYQYGACVKYVPEGSKKAYIITLLSSQSGSGVNVSSKQNVTYTIKVKTGALSKVKLTCKSPVYKKKSATVTAQATLKGAYEKFRVKIVKNKTYKSSDKSVAKVSKDGKITGVSEGSTIISLKIGAKNYRLRIKVS